MKFISCFSGIEAASVASKNLGWEPIVFSEIDPFASAVLAHHYPEVPNVGDITKTNWGEYNGKADIVVGGSPCQDFSIAGLRKSIDGERGNLTLEYIRAIHAVKPRWIMWENVPGVYTANGNPFGQFLAGLCGYDSAIEPPNGKWATSGWLTAANEESYSVAWRVLDAQYFGVPQRRRRIFLVGHLGTGNWWKPLEVLFERKGEGWNPPQSRDKGKAITGSSGSCFAVIMGQTGANGTNVSIDVSPTLDRASPPAVVPMVPVDADRTVGTLCARDFKGVGNQFVSEGKLVVFDSYIPEKTGALCARDYKGITNTNSIADGKVVVLPLNTMNIQGRPSDNNRMESGIGKEGDPCPTITKAHSHAVLISGDSDNQMAFDSRQDCVSSTKVFGALSSSSSSSSSPQAQAVISPVVRRITPVECARLQGFPDNYLDIMIKGKPATDGHKYKALGNSWAVPCVRWIFERLQKVDKIEG